MFFDKIKNAIDKAKIISFDIFDTLLLRPYAKPSDLFAHLEMLENAKGFAAARVEAEKQAREGAEETTIADIYSIAGEQYKHMADKEIALESQTLAANHEMKQIWDYAKNAGKKIIIVSDMYLPRDIISQFLKKNGFGDYDKLFLSSETGARKSTGKMYAHILGEFDARDILHIGDNENADITRARENGIRTAHYQKVLDQYLAAHPRSRKFFDEYGANLGSSIMLSILAWRWQKKALGMIGSDYWTDFGYEYGGPAIYGFTRWIERQAKTLGIKHLAFVARDGYTLQKMFDSYDSGIKTDYVYAPRIFANQVHGGNYSKYLKKMNFPDKIGVVDSASIDGVFTSPKLIQEFLGNNSRVHAFYWRAGISAFPHDNFIGMDMINRRSPYGAAMHNWNLMELIMSAPEYPIHDMDSSGSPVYSKNITKYEEQRKSIYPPLSAGAMDFAKEIGKIFGGKDIFLDAVTLTSWMNIFHNNPSREDIGNMGRAWHSIGDDHSDYAPLASARIGIAEFFRHPVKSSIIIKKIPPQWKTCAQKIISRILNIQIISTRIKPNKKIYRLLGIFPLLMKRKKSNRTLYRWLGFLSFYELLRCMFSIHKPNGYLEIRILFIRFKFRQRISNAINRSSEDIRRQLAYTRKIMSWQAYQMIPNAPRRRVIYTCIAGGYDSLPRHDFIHPDCDYVCFTDDPNLLAQKFVRPWQIRPLAYVGASGIFSNRWHKMHPHVLFPEYDDSIYVDGNIVFVSDNIFKMLEDCNDKIMLAPQHPRRICVYQELYAVIELGYETSENLARLQRFLYRQGMPNDYGMTENNILFRKHNRCRDIRERANLPIRCRMCGLTSKQNNSHSP